MADEHIPAPTDEDVKRIGAVLRSIEHTEGWALARDYYDVWFLEQRMKSDRASTDRLARATWVLVAVTAALMAATVALVVVTL
jgi:hypothetical protein